MTIEKPWATKEVAIAHKYDIVEETTHLNKFVTYCNNLPPSIWSDFPGIKILDLGCGNGRVAISLNKYFDYSRRYFYLGTDINEEALIAGREKLTPNDGSYIKLINFDVDKTPWDANIILDRRNDSSSMNLLKYDVCLIDSTLHMFYKPLDVLNEVEKYCDRIYITRNKLELPSGIQMALFKWGGMTTDSPYWKFSKELFDNWASIRSKKITYESGPTPETYNIIIE
jgi:SAM-dependent methyltransferase